MKYMSTKTYTMKEIDLATASLEQLLDAYNSLFSMSDDGGAFPGSRAWTKAKVYADKVRALRAVTGRQERNKNMSNFKTQKTWLIGASLLTAMLATGCTKDPERVDRSTNPNVAVATLFTHDGCTMYRFEDSGRNHYFARCGDKAETISPKTTTCGKNCYSTRYENITTDGR